MLELNLLDVRTLVMEFERVRKVLPVRLVSSISSLETKES